MQEEKLKVEEVEEEGQEIEIEEKVDDSKEEVVVDTKATTEDKQTESDDLSEYSDSVKKRISKLTNRFREEERQRQAAVEYAEAVKKQNEELKTRIDKLDTTYVGEFDTRVQSQSLAAKEAYRKAVELADIDPDIDISGMPKDLGDFIQSNTAGGATVSMPTEVAHNIKKGLDALIEGETDALTGKVTQRGRMLTKLKKSWNSEIENQNDAYKVANKQFSDNASLKRAYDVGFDFNKTPEEQLAKKVSMMKPAEKEALRVGLVSQIEEMASKTGDATDFVKTVFGTPRRRAALRLSFDNAEQFGRFEKMMKIQADKMRTQRKVFGGSDTAERLMQAGDAGVDPASIYSIGTRAAAGDLAGAVTMAGGQAASRLQGMNARSANKISEMIFNADPATQRKILEQLMQRETSDVASRAQAVRRPELYSGVLGATSGLLAGRSE